MDLIRRHAGVEHVPSNLRVVTDTSDFFRVDYGDVLLLEGHPYLVRNNEREGRFGLDDEQKFWVKRSIDLLTGKMKIIKLSFRERFQSEVGGVVFECVRSPSKEARVLGLVHGDNRFMQGFSVKDDAGNTVRIIDFIPGLTLAESVLRLGGDHRDYYFRHFPGILRTFIGLVEAIGALHQQGEKHGDIRRDHILVDSAQGTCRWIDFDFNYFHRANPYSYDLFGLGNILLYLAGRGDVTRYTLGRRDNGREHSLSEEDLNIVFPNRVVNLRKIYPYISTSMNDIFMHFSAAAETYYDTVDDFLEDLYSIGEEV